MASIAHFNEFHMFNLRLESKDEMMRSKEIFVEEKLGSVITDEVETIGY